MRRSIAALLGSSAGCSRALRSSAARALSRERADLYFEDGSMLSLTNGSPGAERLLPLARRHPQDSQYLTDDELKLALREHAYLEGDFRAALGEALALLPRQVPLRDEARASSRRSASGSHGGARVRAGGNASRRARARRGCARGGGLALFRPSVPDRAQGREGLRHLEPARGRLRERRNRVPRRGRRHFGGSAAGGREGAARAPV